MAGLIILALPWNILSRVVLAGKPLKMMSSSIALSNPPRKVCVLRLSALGDATHVIPLIRNIQDQWPECEITWVCGAFEHKLVLMFCMMVLMLKMVCLISI